MNLVAVARRKTSYCAILMGLSVNISVNKIGIHVTTELVVETPSPFLCVLTSYLVIFGFLIMLRILFVGFILKGSQILGDIPIKLVQSLMK